jgi:hypothetical protein
MNFQQRHQDYETGDYSAETAWLKLWIFGSIRESFKSSRI